jgi:hypothetical protein
MPEEVEFMKGIPYLAAVGALMYLATSTCPDIAYTVGCLARFNSNPGIVHWHAVKHLLCYLKGTADYSITYAPDQIRCMRNLLVEIGFPATAPSILRIDNQSAISVAKHPEHRDHGRMKQLDLSWYWLRDVVHKEIIAPTFVPTTEQPADILTKALARPKVELFCEMLGLGR